MTQGNYETQWLASAARTADVTSNDITNSHYRYLWLYVSVTADSGADVTPNIQIKETSGGAYDTIWTAAAAISAVGEFTYQFGPGLLASVDEAWIDTGNIVIPRTFRFFLDHSDTTSITYSASYGLNL